jgi:hypothetical protein
MVKICQFLGANMTPKIFFANLDTPKGHFLEKICVDWGIMVQVAIAVRAVGFRTNKKRETPPVTVYFTYLGRRPHLTDHHVLHIA